MEKKYIIEQKKLFSKIDLKNYINETTLKNVAGVDLAYWKESDVEYAVCCIVVIDYQSKEIIEKKSYMGRVDIPYIPGCLAFREIELVLKTVEQLKNDIQLYIFDGNGYLHPRHMGLATHAGILLDKPSIGIAKSYYKIFNVDYIEPANEKFAYEDIIIDNELYGRVLRTHKNVKPVFVSIGNKIDIDTSMIIAKSFVTEESHIPMPTRYADIMSHEMRKNYREKL